MSEALAPSGVAGSGPWMAWALLALAALCAYALAMKRLLGRPLPYPPVLLSAAVFVGVGLLGAGARLLDGAIVGDLGRLAQPGASALVALDVLLYCAAPWLYYRALQRLPVSQVVTVQALIGVFALLGGVVLGLERPSAARVAGAALVVLAIAGVSAGPGARRISRPTLDLVASTALYAGGALVDQQLVARFGLDPQLMLGVAFLAPGLILSALSLRVAGLPARTLARVMGERAVLGNMLALFVAYSATYRAYALGGSASGVTLVLACEAVVVVALAALLLRERERLPWRLAAGALVAVGLGLIGGSA